MTSHNVVGRRVSQFEYFGPKSPTFNPDDYYGLAEYRADAIQAGTPFPDYLYLCGDEHDAGEEAHWTPFQLAAVDYIREKYPTWVADGRDSAGAGLVAFMLGVTSHYIADINWHGLETIPSGEGLIRTMGYADFNCTDGDLCGIAHSAADTGGEFAAAASMDLTWFPQRHWYLPVDDLVNIYAAMNATGQGPMVEPEWIRRCGVVFYAGSWAVSTFGHLIYPLMAPSLGPLLLEEYNNFPVGGVADDAAWTGFMWNRLAGWLSDGTPDVPPPHMAGHSRQLLDKLAMHRPEAHKFRHNWVQAMRSALFEGGEGEVGGLFGTSEANTQGGVFVGSTGLATASAATKERAMRVVVDALLDEYVQPLMRGKEGRQAELETVRQVLHAEVAKMAGFATAAPDENELVLSTEDKEDPSPAHVVTGAEAHEFYGYSITTGSFGRGRQGVLIGSPGSGRSGGPQEGMARMVFEASNHTVEFRGGQGSALPSYERFGWSSTACDVNGDGQVDAVICAPSFGGGSWRKGDTEAAKGNYTGRCDVFYGPFGGVEPHLLMPDVSINGDKEWGEFGHAVTAGDVDGDGLADLVISAPYAGNYQELHENSRGDLSSQGAVYVFLASSFASTFGSNTKSIIASIAADSVIQPEASFQWFGKSLLVTDKMLLVGAPAYHPVDEAADVNSAVGRVYALQLLAWQATEVSSTSIESTGLQWGVEWTITGCGHSGRTGHALAASGGSEERLLAFSEPAFNATKSDAENEFAAVSTATETVLRTLSSMRNNQVLRAGRVILTKLSAVHDVAAAAVSSGADVKVCDLLSASDAVAIELRGSEFDGRFGSTLLFTKGAEARTDVKGLSAVGAKDNLVVGEPLAGYGSGAVHIFDVTGGKAQRVRHIRGSRAFGRKSKGRLGHALAVSAADSGVHVLHAGAPYLTSADSDANATSSLYQGEEVGAVVGYLL